MKRSRIEARQAGHRWVPLEPATRIPVDKARLERRIAHACRVFPDQTEQEIREAFAQFEDEYNDIWVNDRYQVAVRRIGDDPPMIHLSIKTLDRRPVRDWRDCQRIKNQLVGPECEGVELYPAESRLVDTSNQYHIWCIADPTFRFPFGWESGRRVADVSGGGAVQRPLDE